MPVEVLYFSALQVDSKKSEKLNERALRLIYNGFDTDYNDLANHVRIMLANQRYRDMLCTVFKAMINELPSYIKNMLIFRDDIKNLKSMNKLVLPRVHTRRYGLKSVICTASKE